VKGSIRPALSKNVVAAAGPVYVPAVKAAAGSSYPSFRNDRFPAERMTVKTPSTFVYYHS